MKTKLFISLLISSLIVASARAVNEDPTPRDASEKAKTHQNVMISNELLAAVQRQINKKVLERNNSLTITPKEYSTEGWLEEKIKQLQDLVTEKINEIRKKFAEAVEQAANKVMVDLRNSIKNFTPSYQFDGLYSYKEGRRENGSWSGVTATVVGPSQLVARGGASFSIQGAVGFGIEVLIPAKLDAQLTGGLKMVAPVGSTLKTYPPTNKPSLKVESPAFVDITVGFDVQVEAGFSINAGATADFTFPLSDVTATLDAGKGHLLVPLVKEE